MKIFQYIVAYFFSLAFFNLHALNYTIQDLGTLTSDRSYATEINTQNTVVGYTKTGDQITTFMWKPAEGLSILPCENYESPLINNLDQIAGIFWHTTKTNYFFAPNVETRSKHVYIYDNQILQDLGFPEKWPSQKIENWQTPSLWNKKDLHVVSFNDDGSILVANGENSDKATRFAIWQNGAFKEIDPTIISKAYKMNNQGVILAQKWIKKENLNLPMLVLYNPIDQTITEITKDINITNKQLNDKGDVIFVKNLNKKSIKGFLWSTEKGMIELENFVPIAFNNCNQIIGYELSKFLDNEIVPLIWEDSEISSLLPVFESSELELGNVSCVNAINDHGYIIGHALFQDKIHPFILIPKK